MDTSLLNGYPLDQLRDYSVRDRLTNCVYQNHQHKGVPSLLTEQFVVRIDTLIGLALNHGVQCKTVRRLFNEIEQQFAFGHHFDDTLDELAALIKLR